MSHVEAERHLELLQIKNRLEEIRSTIYICRRPIREIEACVTGRGKGPDRPPTQGWASFPDGSQWGGLDQTTWFRFNVIVPPEMEGQTVVALVSLTRFAYIHQSIGLEEGGEGLAYVNGVPRQGIDRNHDELLLTEKATAGQEFEIAIEACPSTRFDIHHVFGFVDFAAKQVLPWNFYWDAHVVLDVCRTLPEDSCTRHRLINVLNRAVKNVDLQRLGQASYYESLAQAQAYLREELRNFPTTPDAGSLVLAGHAHIDTAWLWPLRETKRKCARTFSTVLGLMDRYEELTFSCSQPLQYAWLQEHYPELFERVRQRVAEGRWELCGGAWVEPDHNIPSGESLIRQYLYGNRWFEQTFGKRSHIAWVPDSFGYAWSLPQILRKCQIRAFLTTKLEWSQQYMRFPHSMFLWEGPDGTRIPALMPPQVYNGDPTPKDCITQWRQFRQKALVDRVPFAFGHGDGGGGPTQEMLERGRRMANLASVPRCEFGGIEGCVDGILNHCSVETLPVFRDELYLELHRACQTTQARTKRDNRKCEFALQNAEFLGCLALAEKGTYDALHLEQAWKLLLTNQFHDILPGSSINEVYAQCDKDYAEAFRLCLEALQSHRSSILPRIDTSGRGTPWVVFNPTSWLRSDMVCLGPLPEGGSGCVTDRKGKILPHQVTDEGHVLFVATDVPAYGYAVFYLLPDGVSPATNALVTCQTHCLENAYVRVELDDQGSIRRIYDKINGREVLAVGATGNALKLFDDRPHAHDAWDMDFNFEEIVWEPRGSEHTEVCEAGPLRAVVRVTRRTERSIIRQDIILHAHSPRIDFVTHVEWHEKRALLKVAFPVDIRANLATFDIQFATIERPTHCNWDHDRAAFEVPAQKWADLSEGDYGVSLLNDCKYGYDVRDNVLRLSLLRSPLDPDPEADQGNHEFVYSLYPHAGDWRNGTVREAYNLNNPLIVVPAENHAGTLPSCFSFIRSDADHVVIETLKKHEDSDAVIVRLFEAYGQRGTVSVHFGKPPLRVTECDCMEENDTPLEVEGDTVSLYVRPYEIRTLKVEF
ncbi:MAG: hypothetical protein GWP08_09475 [Nitrospiraceae bacterium]|nr:hypothetical protein [Nitrospiraceae bacterium]